MTSKMTDYRCDRCGQPLSANEILLGWPVLTPAGQHICPTCYSDEAYCSGEHLLPANTDSDASKCDKEVFEPDFDDVAEGLDPGVYCADNLNPPSGSDCTHIRVYDDGLLSWCDEEGCLAGSRFTAEDLCSNS